MISNEYFDRIINEIKQEQQIYLSKQINEETDHKYMMLLSQLTNHILKIKAFKEPKSKPKPKQKY